MAKASKAAKAATQPKEIKEVKKPETTVAELVEKIKDNPKGISGNIDLDKLEQLTLDQKGLPELSPEELLALFIEKGILVIPAPKKEWKPAIPVIPDTPTTAQAPVSFPANKPVYTAAPAPQSLAELKDYIAANSGSDSFQDITLPLMQHYNLQDKASAKLVRVALEQLEAEKRVVVEGDYWKNLGKHHYNNGPETSFYSLRDIKVSIRKV